MSQDSEASAITQEDHLIIHRFLLEASLDTEQDATEVAAAKKKVITGWLCGSPRNWTPEIRAWVVKRYKTTGMEGIHEGMLKKFDYTEYLRPDDISENLDEIMNNPDSKYYFKKNPESDYYDEEVAKKKPKPPRALPKSFALAKSKAAESSFSSSSTMKVTGPPPPPPPKNKIAYTEAELAANSDAIQEYEAHLRESKFDRLNEQNESFDLSEAQMKVMNRIMSKQNVFFTGAAGTGKSYCVTILKKVLELLDLKHAYAMTAPTGVAAANVSGMTIHSWAGVGIGTGSPESIINKVRSNRDANSRWRNTRILVIDEISMVSAELFDLLDMVAKAIRNSFEPFGGIQMIFCGDFYQLPPVSKGSETHFCFESPLWSQTLGPDGVVVLNKIFRQKDSKFLRILNEIRRGECSYQTEMHMNAKVIESARYKEQRIEKEKLALRLEKKRQMQEEYRKKYGHKTGGDSSNGDVKKEAATDSKIGVIGENETSNVSQSSASTLETKEVDAMELPITHTILNPRNDQVNQYNTMKLKSLPPYSEDEPVNRIICIDRAKGNAPKYLHQLKDLKAPVELDMKLGAQVMLLKNLDVNSGLVNGALGEIVDWFKVELENLNFNRGSDEMIAAEFPNGTHLPVVKFTVNLGGKNEVLPPMIIYPAKFTIESNGEEVASRKQIPLMLAWAITIHKSQGLTIPYLEMTFSGMFECGQGYVALSRATDMEGEALVLNKFDKSNIRAHSKVIKYYKERGFTKEEVANEDEQPITITLFELCRKYSEDKTLFTMANPTSRHDVNSNPKNNNRKNYGKAGMPQRASMDEGDWVDNTNPQKHRAMANYEKKNPSKHKRGSTDFDDFKFSDEIKAEKEHANDNRKRQSDANVENVHNINARREKQSKKKVKKDQQSAVVGSTSTNTTTSSGPSSNEGSSRKDKMDIVPEFATEKDIKKEQESLLSFMDSTTYNAFSEDFRR